MPTAERRELAAKAEAYSIARSALVAANGEPEAWGSLPPPGTRLACPALDEQGACLIYERRPLICRKFGIPLYNPRRPGRVFACELNFREGEPVEDPDLVRIQTGIHEQSRALQDAYNASGRRRDPRPITVARAILEDFTDCG
jgi:Fe-S-cluster containining protein